MIRHLELLSNLAEAMENQVANFTLKGFRDGRESLPHRTESRRFFVPECLRLSR